MAKYSAPHLVLIQLLLLLQQKRRLLLILENLLLGSLQRVRRSHLTDQFHAFLFTVGHLVLHRSTADCLLQVNDRQFFVFVLLNTATSNIQPA